MSPLRVAVLGATGYLGAPLTRALAADPEIEYVLALGRRGRPAVGSAAATGVAYAHCDAVTGPIEALLAQHRIDALVHLAFTSRPSRDRGAAFATNVIGATRTLTAAGRAGVRRVVLVSSVGVYGPRTGPEPVTEDAPPRPNSFQFSRDKALQELAAHSSASTAGLELAIARPCTVVGGAGANFVLELLAGPIVPLPAFTDAPWQFLHVDDFCAGVIGLVTSSTTGPYNLVPADAVPLREAVRMLGGHPVSLPRALLAGAARATWALHAGRAVPPAALAFLDRPPIASGARANRDFGFVPALESRGALLAAGRPSAPVDRSLRLVPQGRR